MTNCKQCSSAFEVAEWDSKLMDQLAPEFGGKKCPIPNPTLCPQCRSQRRLNWRSELHLFTRKSDKTGESMISFFPPNAPYKVWKVSEWWEDDWNALDYGRDFDFSRPFFEQFDELMHDVPQMGLSVINNQNSDYINNAGWNKNCYLLAGANENEDCYYGNFVNNSKNCMDCSFVMKSEICYECIDCTNCYNLKYSQNCENCSDSAFLFNCTNSRDCFGSVNLVGKQYVFMNKQLTKDEYQKKIAGLQLYKRSRVEEAKKFFRQHRLKYPHKYMIGEMNENVTGNYVHQSRNSEYCFDGMNLEDCKYVGWFSDSKSCMDIYAWGTPGTEKCYECMEVGAGSQHNLFSALIYNGTDNFYSYFCLHSQHLFGCVSLRHKKYCIFNKQYSKEEYESLIPKIIEHMKKAGEWGEFFPTSICPLNYNQSIAQDYAPITKEEAEKLGTKWADEPPIIPPETKVEVSDSINDVDESIVGQIFTCEKTGKPYKIIPQEFKFYKENNIPIPAYCFDVRHKNRLHQRNPRDLWDRQCDKCGIDIKTSYAPERPEKVYCEHCYLKNIY